MHKRTKNIGGHDYVIYGANADLVAWVETSDLAAQALGPAKVTIDDLYLAFGAEPDAARTDYSKSVIKKLWYSEPVLGPYPFLDTLSFFEFDRLFYANYRDHVCHQLKVYLLGLFAYDCCPKIRDELDRSLSIPSRVPRAEFLLRWLVTALYHDIGYVLENDKALQGDGSAWQTTRGEINRVLAAPLSAMPTFGDFITPDVEQRLIQDHQIFTPKVSHIKDIEYYNKINLLDQLASEARLAQLGVNDAPLRDYYDYALTHDTIAARGSRGRYRDHGIVSALLLLRTWRAFSDYLAIFSTKAGNDPLIRSQFARVDDLARRVSLQAESIRAAAAAMALHNITPKDWDHGEALAHGLTLPRFKICLSAHGNQLPLAFLLGLVDSLQDWDRPRFRARRDTDKAVLLDQDMSITTGAGKLLLHLPADLVAYRVPASVPDSSYSKAIRAMKEYLEPEAIDAIVAWTDTPVPTAPMIAPETLPTTAVAGVPLDPVLPTLDRLPQAFQSYGKTTLFTAGTSFVTAAKRRVVLVAKTPIPVVGARPYEDGGDSPYYEREQYDAYLNAISRAAVPNGVEFTCIGSLSAFVADVKALKPSARPGFFKRVEANLIRLEQAASANGSRCRVRWTDDARPMTFLVTDDTFLVWLKDERGDNVCFTAQSPLIADALATQASRLGREVAIVDLLSMLPKTADTDRGAVDMAGPT